MTNAVGRKAQRATVRKNFVYAGEDRRDAARVESW
jgi:hypothetical protein